MTDTVFKCPYCAEEIKYEAQKCKHCGEWLNENEQSKFDESLDKQEAAEDINSSQVLKTIFGIVSLVAFIFIGYLFGGWVGSVIGLFLWLVGLGSIGLTKDISDAGEAARQNKKKG